MSDTQEILVLTTGGTIDKQYFDALSEYHITDSVVSKLLGIAKVTQPFKIQEVLRKDSLEMTDDDRRVIMQHVALSEAARVVITHGTDTMVKTASELSAIRGKTIVLTGALTPARFSESDAAFNLGMAFATAQIAAPGVYITMNGAVFSGKVRKDRALGRFVRDED